MDCIKTGFPPPITLSPILITLVFSLVILIIMLLSQPAYLYSKPKERMPPSFVSSAAFLKKLPPVTTRFIICYQKKNSKYNTNAQMCLKAFPYLSALIRKTRLQYLFPSSPSATSLRASSLLGSLPAGSSNRTHSSAA